MVEEQTPPVASAGQAILTTDDKIMLYAYPTCPMVHPVRVMLDSAQVPYEYINIHQDDAGRRRVRDINQGYESVPTLVFPDGSTMTEPTGGQLQGKLESLGYTVPLRGRLQGYIPLLIIILILLAMIARGVGWL